MDFVDDPQACGFSSLLKRWLSKLVNQSADTWRVVVAVEYEEGGRETSNLAIEDPTYIARNNKSAFQDSKEKYINKAMLFLWSGRVCWSRFKHEGSMEKHVGCASQFSALIGWGACWHELLVHGKDQSRSLFSLYKTHQISSQSVEKCL